MLQLNRKIYTTFFLFISLVVCSISANGQDLILKRSGDEIKAKVVRIEAETITYKQYTRLNGPDYLINRTDVFMITYEDGSKDVFSETGEIKSILAEKKTIAPTPVPSSPAVVKAPEPETRYESTTTVTQTRVETTEPVIEESTDEPSPSRFYIAYSGSLQAPIGLQVGSIGGDGLGIFVSARFDGLGEQFEGLYNGYTCNDDGIDTYNPDGYSWTGHELTTRGSVTIGISRQSWDLDYFNFYMALGYGYLNYWHLYDETSSPYDQVWANHEDWDVEGLEMELGIILDFNGFNLNTGISTLNFTVYDWTFGVGVSF